jgi:beta-lactamase class A
MKLLNVIAPLITLAIGIVIGVTVHDRMMNGNQKKTFIERREGGYKYINPLLECDIADNVLRNKEIRPFKHKIEAFIKSNQVNQKSVSVSVYLRELNDGLWFSVGETNKFIPASLRKLPLMIALLKQAERTKENYLLDQNIKFDLTQDYNANQNVKPSQTMIPGRSYTVRDLIFRMIAYSDNNAFTLLTKVVNPTELENVYPNLRMLNPLATQDDDFLSVQTYASFLRILYNATYLNKLSSEWALDTLSKSEFTAGIVSGVPQNVTVAHKFGEKSDAATGTVQLHDCGIVYFPQHPYLLCVMSKGPDFTVLNDIIRGVSQISFTEISEQHQAH